MKLDKLSSAVAEDENMGKSSKSNYGLITSRALNLNALMRFKTARSVVMLLLHGVACFSSIYIFNDDAQRSDFKYAAEIYSAN